MRRGAASPSLPSAGDDNRESAPERERTPRCGLRTSHSLRATCDQLDHPLRRSPHYVACGQGQTDLRVDSSPASSLAGGSV
eukprot:6943646-Prymnesium_polylepis.2